MSGASEASAHRRRKVSNFPSASASNGVDRISGLPEALIIHILSLLPTTQDRIRTSALSRRWKDLWTCVPKLNFIFDYNFQPDDDDYEWDDEERAVDDFVKCVDKTLHRILSCGAKVTEFAVKCPYIPDYRSSVGDWVRFAATNETEKFELDFQPWEGHCDSFYALPQHLYTSPYFRELRFNYCNFYAIPKRVSWVSLKKLTVESGAWFPSGEEEGLKKIVAGAPALEFLYLQLCEGIFKLHLGNYGLKKLVVDIKGWDDDRGEEAVFEISASRVESLQVSGRFRSCKLVDMASLVEATLLGVRVKGDSDYPILTEEVVSSLSNVKTLTVGTWVIQGIPKLPTNNGHPLFPKCKCLTVDTHLWKEDPSAIARLLKNTPQVETLTVTMSEFDSKTKFNQDNHSRQVNSNVDQYWMSQEMASNSLTHLKKVKFIGFWAYRTVAFPFVQLVLKNARGLQEVVIDLEAKDILHEIAPTELVETFQKLLSYPRSSPDAKLLIYP